MLCSVNFFRFYIIMYYFYKIVRRSIKQIFVDVHQKNMAL